MSKDKSPWIIKYRPKTVRDVVGQTKATEDLLNYIKSFDRQKKKAIMLYGPPGCGKTSMVYAIAEELGHELIEVNASDRRNKNEVLETLGPASMQMSLFGGSKLILVDEIDGLSGSQDRGGTTALIDVIKKTKFPIILTTNDPWSQKLKTLRNYCVMVQLRKLNVLSVAKYLKQILSQEGVVYEESAIKKLAGYVDGDLRAAVNDLQMLSSSGKIVEKELTLWKREQEESLFSALKLIFKSYNSEATSHVVDNLSEDLKMLSYWLEENIPIEYFNPAERRNAYRALGDYDIFMSRIMRWQHWRFMYYARLLLVMGVQQAKNDVNPRYVMHKRPEILKKIFIRAAKRAKIQGIARQIGAKLHCSAGMLAKDFLPYYNFIQENNPEMGREINEFLELDIR